MEELYASQLIEVLQSICEELKSLNNNLNDVGTQIYRFQEKFDIIDNTLRDIDATLTSKSD